MQVIEKARKRLIEIEKERKRLEDFIALYDQLGSDSEISRPEIQPAKRTAKPKNRGSRPAEIIRFAKVAIKESGVPMTRTQLVSALESKGLTIGGTDKSKNMGTILWRSGVFDNIEGHGYWPKDSRPYDDKVLF